GKQAVDWGKMRFYSPLDVFNTVGPIELERDQRSGIDAINFNFSSSEFGGVNLVASPGHHSEESHYGLKLYQKFGTYDLALIASHVSEDETLGVSFDGYLGKAGFRGELAQVWLSNDRNFSRASLGLDYNFTEKLYILGEYFYNGGPEDNNPSALAFSYDNARRFFSLEKNLLGWWVQYEWTALFKSNLYLIYDWDGKSVVTNPELRYSPTQNFDFALGAQLFWGESLSEFGDLKNIYYAEAKWFF
ncbi:MAG: hypothetical protein NUV91_08645, partial [Candidatus Omnitrophica bacterium]|nr:hypothetical protein [Candidatus Omnitrophota bacterium]